MGEGDAEREWIRKCQQGDAGAFEKLVKRHQRMVHALTYRMTASISDAEDLAQETFVRAWQQIGSFRGEASFSSWVYQIAVNTCLNWRKSAQRRAELHREWANEKRDPSTEDAMAAPVQEALLKLKPQQRAAVILTTYDGMNHAEAARLLGCSEATVSWRIFVARKKLKQLLRDLVRQP
jgi:RNA polymerase sigma-70 factor (ECF subfamily)